MASRHERRWGFLQLGRDALVSLSHDSRPPGSPPDFEPAVIYSRVFGRWPQWKAHGRLRDAKSALAFRGSHHLNEIWIYHDGEWRRYVD